MRKDEILNMYPSIKKQKIIKLEAKNFNKKRT